MRRRSRCAAAVAATAVAAGCSGCAGDPGAPGAAPSAPAAPAAEARSAPFVLVPDARGAVARVRAPAGGRAPVRLRLANASDAPRVLALHARAPWLAVAPSVHVPARQSVAVEAVVRVPPDARGSLRGLVVARAEGDVTAAVAVSYESAVHVAVDVGAAP